MPLAAATGQSDSSITPQAHELHFSSIVIDTHDDTTQRLLDPKFDLGARHSDGGIDIPRMREGGLSAISSSRFTFPALSRAPRPSSAPSTRLRPSARP